VSRRKFLIILVAVGYPFIMVAGFVPMESGRFGGVVGGTPAGSMLIASLVAGLIALCAFPGFLAARRDVLWPWGGLVGLGWATGCALLTFLLLVGNSDYGVGSALDGAIGIGVPAAVFGVGWLVGFAVYYRLGVIWRDRARRSDA